MFDACRSPMSSPWEEVVAAQANDRLCKEVVAAYTKQARAAIAAMREPTGRMNGAGAMESCNQTRASNTGVSARQAGDMYRKMIDTALEEQP